MAQICADTLGVDYRNVRVIHGQTDRIAYGIGAHASRATVLTGNAVHVTAQKLREKALSFASELLQTPSTDLRSRTATSLRTANSAHRYRSPKSRAAQFLDRPLLGARAPDLTAEGWYTPTSWPSPTACTSQPWRSTAGPVRCPSNATSLPRRSAGRSTRCSWKARSSAAACRASAAHSTKSSSIPIPVDPLSATLADYLIPTVHEAPGVEVLICEDMPSPVNPLGLRGAGEGGINGVGATIANAVEDALQQSGAVTRLPIRPQRLMAQTAACSS